MKSLLTFHGSQETRLSGNINPDHPRGCEPHKLKCLSPHQCTKELIRYYQPGAREVRELVGPKIALRFPRLFVCMSICVSTLTTCAIIRHVLLCNYSLLLY